MSRKPRFVFDSSTIVSAFLFEQAKPGRALQAALDGGELLLSAEVVTELNDVLGREKFDRYLGRKKRKELLSALIEEGVIVEVTEEIEACRDPKDDKFLELAVSGEAVCIVSGDEDLLVLNPFRGIPILQAREFLDWLAKTTL